MGAGSSSHSPGTSPKLRSVIVGSLPAPSLANTAGSAERSLARSDSPAEIAMVGLVASSQPTPTTPSGSRPWSVHAASANGSKPQRSVLLLRSGSGIASPSSSSCVRGGAKATKPSASSGSSRAMVVASSGARPLNHRTAHHAAAPRAVMPATTAATSATRLGQRLGERAAAIGEGPVTGRSPGRMSAFFTGGRRVGSALAGAGAAATVAASAATGLAVSATTAGSGMRGGTGSVCRCTGACSV